MDETTRVMYEAALARVQERMCYGAEGGCNYGICKCVQTTLAALGLNESSTKPFDKRDYPMAFPATADTEHEAVITLPRLLAQGNPCPPQQANVYLRDIITALDRAGWKVIKEGA